MHLRKNKILFFFLCSITVCSNLAFAEGKHTFPAINEQDLSYYFNKQEKREDPNLYLFSSLSFISLKKDSIAFKLTKTHYDNLIPLCSINVYPAIDYYIKSEYLDFTIWGQLGNYFNKNIEMVAVENKISSLLKELEEINDRYNSLFTDKPQQFELKYIPTVSESNYFHEYKEEENGEEQEVDLGNAQTNDNSYEVDILLNEIILTTQSNKFEKKLHLSKRTQNSGSKGLSGNQGMASNSKLKVKSSPSLESQTWKKSSSSQQTQTWIGSLLSKLMRLPSYLVNNKIETSIYLFFLLLVVTILTRIFTPK